MPKHMIAWHSKCFEVSEKARKVASLEAMVKQLEGIASELAQQIAVEEARCRNHDPTNVLYSTLAIATAQRRANLLKSVVDLRAKLFIAKREHERAKAELLALEPVDLRDANQQLNKNDHSHREGAQIDGS
jgi:multidrug resistance efflux pump